MFDLHFSQKEKLKKSMQFQFIVTGWYKLEREREREALTCITNCSFYSAPTLEEVLDKPWCYVTRSSSHTHHLLLSTHPLCDSLSISLCVSLCVCVFQCEAIDSVVCVSVCVGAFMVRSDSRYSVCTSQDRVMSGLILLFLRNMSGLG